jgi:hypothetical protein
VRRPDGVPERLEHETQVVVARFAVVAVISYRPAR